jgi:hypothetical protein
VRTVTHLGKVRRHQRSSAPLTLTADPLSFSDFRRQALLSLLTDLRDSDGLRTREGGPAGPFIADIILQAVLVEAHLQNGIDKSETRLAALHAASGNSPTLAAAIAAFPIANRDRDLLAVVNDAKVIAAFKG